MTGDGRFSDAGQAVLQCQKQFWLALQHKDAELFTQVLAEDFVCRSPGEADQDRSAFIATLTTTPLMILNVSGESIEVRLMGEVAVLTGTQVAQMRLPNGETVSERLALTNIFQRNEGQWEMVLAHPVSLPS
jgi:ketosteroid isomerase-like protein